MIKSILIVDDHPTVGYGTKAILERRFNCHVTYVMTGSQAISKLHGQRYDIVLCDFMMPTMDGLQTARELKLAQADIKIIMYTGFALEHYHNALIDAGVSCVLSKESSVEDLEAAITAIMRGYTLVSSDLFMKLRIPSFLGHVTDNEMQKKWKLNDEDIELLQGIVNGYSNKELAQLYHRSQRAVEYHITKLYNKLNVRSRIQLMRFALMYNVVNEEADNKQTV